VGYALRGIDIWSMRLVGIKEEKTSPRDLHIRRVASSSASSRNLARNRMR